ncbi:dihydrofolate reductase-like [Leptidea sinapis]|uniref:dihydrofolate reductase-like n=1 Tax=Leptidea sinapis TaxID=189913 RepID=UPI002140D6C7|nr:dihydrofolate reductase-like [Leptidea sinapis]
MSKMKLNLIAAVSENLGIGDCGALPWRLKKEMAYFTSLTTDTKDPSKKNAVIMGRVSWDCIPAKFRPLKDRVNIILTHNVDAIKKKISNEQNVEVAGSLDDALKMIEARYDIETTWVIGGSHIYKLGLEHPNCHRVYLTEIKRTFTCDTFFPVMDKSKFKCVDVDGVSSEKQVENGIEYYFKVYEKLPNVEEKRKVVESTNEKDKTKCC